MSLLSATMEQRWKQYQHAGGCDLHGKRPAGAA
jgi:hypothetical protein